MAINDSTLSVDVWNDIRAKLVATGLYVTNSKTGTTTSASIRASYHDETATRPQVIINPINYDEANWYFGSKHGKKMINVFIECYYKNTLGIDQLSDQVLDAVKDNDISGVNLIGITTDYAFSDPNENKYQLKTITLTYDRE